MKDSITLYSSPTCPICKMLKMELDKKGLEYSYVNDVDTLLRLGITHPPVLEVNGVRMQAPQARNWIKEQ